MTCRTQLPSKWTPIFILQFPYAATIPTVWTRSIEPVNTLVKIWWWPPEDGFCMIRNMSGWSEFYVILMCFFDKYVHELVSTGNACIGELQIGPPDQMQFWAKFFLFIFSSGWSLCTLCGYMTSAFIAALLIVP